MQIFVKFVTGKKLVIRLQPGATVKDLREKISEKEGVAIEKIKLTFRGKYLQNQLALSDYNIGNNATVDYSYEYNAQEQDKNKGTVVTHTPSINTCPSMKGNSKTCAVYNDFYEYKYSPSGLNHIQLYSHCGIVIRNCRHGVQCKAYTRLMNGGVRLADRCHVTVFAHPPPSRNQEYTDINDSAVYPFIFGKVSVRASVNKDNIDQKDEKTKDSYNKYVKDWNYPNEYVEKALLNRVSRKYRDPLTPLFRKKEDNVHLLKLLYEEIEMNSDLSKKTAQDGNYKLDLITPDGIALIDIVDKVYMNHERHVKMGKPLNRAEMLSIVLYTGTEMNYDLCRSQRIGNYKKWPVFDYCLNNAVKKLCDHEVGDYPV